MSSTLTDLTAATTWSGTDLFYALIGGNSRKIAAAKFLVAETSSSLAMQDSTTAQIFRVYNTFTDSSNYVRLAFSSSSDRFFITTETAGTGADTVHLALVPAGNNGWVYSENGIRCLGGDNIDKGLGYAQGAGGSVTQITSKSTSVTLNRICGQITTHNETVTANDSRTFDVNCSVVASTDIVIAQHIGSGTAGAYRITAGQIGGASFFKLTITNISGGSLGEAIVINYAIFKASNA